MPTLVQMIPWVFSIATLATTITLWLLARSKKGLGYEVLSVEPLFEKKSDDASALEIRYKGKAVADPHLVKIRICNAERGVLSAKDFKLPITVTFKTVDVVEFKPLECSQKGSRPTVNWEPREVSIQGLDLNAGSSMIMTVLASGKLDPEHDVECTTFIYDAVKDGNARRLKVGASPIFNGIGTVFKLLFFLVIVGGGIFTVYIFAWSIFRNGVRNGVIVLLALGGLGVGEIVLIGGLRFLLNRRNWPLFLR